MPSAGGRFDIYSSTGGGNLRWRRAGAPIFGGTGAFCMTAAYRGTLHQVTATLRQGLHEQANSFRYSDKEMSRWRAASGNNFLLRNVHKKALTISLGMTSYMSPRNCPCWTSYV